MASPILLKTLNVIARKALKWSILHKMEYPLAHLLSWNLYALNPSTNSVKRFRILVLKHLYFRGELEMLARTERFELIIFPPFWHMLLLRIFWGDIFDRKKTDRNDYYKPSDPEIIKLREEIRKGLKIFLKTFYKIARIDCVIGANFQYLHNFDIGAVSQKLGISYVVLHRENFVASRGAVETWKKRGINFGNLECEALITHNTEIRDALLSAGMIDQNRIYAAGCLRMDDYIERLKSPEGMKKFGQAEKQATLFSFNHINCLFGIIKSKDFYEPGVGLHRFFEKVHIAFAEVAKEMPDVRFVIKTKPQFGARDVILSLLSKQSPPLNALKNLHVLEDADVHDIIMSSDVICSFGSTTLLESAVAGKPVIVPFFEEAVKKEYEDHIIMKDYFDVFQVAKSPEGMKALIRENLDNPVVSNEYIMKVRRLFDRFVSSFEGRAIDRYVAIISDACEKGKTARGLM